MHITIIFKLKRFVLAVIYPSHTKNKHQWHD